MTLKTAQDVMKVAKARGFKIKINPGPPPMPYLHGDKNQATPALMDALKAWRIEIIEELSKESAS